MECAECGQQFEPRVKTQRFCSAFCRSRASSRRYRSRFPSKISDANRAYRLNNPEYSKERDRRYRQENPEKVKAKDLRIREKNKDRRHAQATQWKKNNPERTRELAREGTQRRRSRKIGAPVEKFTHREIFERDGWICQLCKKPIKQGLPRFDRGAAQLDHIIPVSDPDYPGHLRNNVQASHRGCNLSKLHRTIPDGEQLRLT